MDDKNRLASERSHDCNPSKYARASIGQNREQRPSTPHSESLSETASSHPGHETSYPGNKVYKSMKSKHRQYRSDRQTKSNRNRRHARKLPESNRNSRPTRATTIGISGPPSSGKTSLAHLLYAVLSRDRPACILHLDDFALPKTHIVPYKDGTLDADCKGAFDLDDFRRVLRFARKHSKLPPTFVSTQQGATDSEMAMRLVDAGDIEAAHKEVNHVLTNADINAIVLVEGGQLFRSREVLRLLDLKLFLRTGQKVSGSRRFNGQPGYTNSDRREWWKTTAYFDHVAWPNYLAQNAGLFEHKDVESGKMSEKCQELRIDVQPQVDLSARDSLVWSIKTLAHRLKLETPESGQGGGTVPGRRRKKPTFMQRVAQVFLQYWEKRFSARR
ncbi:MAG: ribosylnicotinamide kinase [Stictis urceolatum]|nr:ribosylnicotinamide kinase [Stictis urceolata]